MVIDKKAILDEVRYVRFRPMYRTHLLVMIAMAFRSGIKTVTFKQGDDNPTMFSLRTPYEVYSALRCGVRMLAFNRIEGLKLNNFFIYGLRFKGVRNHCRVFSLNGQEIEIRLLTADEKEQLNCRKPRGS